jgi:hypothetical protein
MRMSDMKNAYQKCQESWVPGHVDVLRGPNLSSNKTANWALASATKSEMVSNRTHHKGRNGKTVTLSRAWYAQCDRV